MKCVVVDMRNRLFGDAISGSLQHFDSGFRVYQTEGTAAEDLCVDTHADVLVAEVTAYPPWRLEQRLGLPGCQVALVVDEVCEPQLADQVRRAKKDGLIDGFFYSSVSSDYLSAMIDAL
jgi:23S rRNA G2069 N7-methylase RlmK/C1962 C5-methylase RlmI